MLASTLTTPKLSRVKPPKHAASKSPSLAMSYSRIPSPFHVSYLTIGLTIIEKKRVYKTEEGKEIKSNALNRHYPLKGTALSRFASPGVS